MSLQWEDALCLLKKDMGQELSKYIQKPKEQNVEGGMGASRHSSKRVRNEKGGIVWNGRDSLDLGVKP